MTENDSGNVAGETNMFELMSRLVDQHPELSDEEILKLYQKQTQQQATIALLSDQLTDQTKVILASALPTHHEPQSANSQAQYKIEKRIDSGGQSHVYLAHRDDGTYQKSVVIKVLNQSIEGTTQKEQLMAEMQILADLKHPNIVSILDAGIDEQQRPWLMLDYIKGQHIDSYVKNKQLNQTQIVGLILATAQALRYIHRENIAHLDIKPANVLVEEIDGTARPIIIDFGIAMTQNLMTEQTPYTFATPAFAAPEQLQSEQSPDHRSDIYALGKLLKHLLAENHTKNSSDEPQLPADLKAIINHCTQEQPADRFQQTQDLIIDLQNFINHNPVSVRPLKWWQNGMRIIQKHQWLIPVVVVFIGLGGWILNDYVSQQSQQQEMLNNAKQSQVYWQGADEIHNQTRLIYALPRRNIEDDFQQLNEQYLRLKQQFNQEQAAVQTLAHVAMAKAATSLGHFNDAHTHLLQAFEANATNLQIRNLLSKSYLLLYQAEAEGLQNFAEMEQRQLQHNRLQQKYFKPALTLLKPNKLPLEHDLVVSSLLLHFENQSQAALQQLKSADDNELWPIDRYLLAAEISRDQANHHINLGQISQALDWLQQTTGYLHQAQAIARSHPEVHKRLCQTESLVAQLSPQSVLATLDSCEHLMVLLPNTADALLVAANAYAQLAHSWLDRGQSPLPLMATITGLLEHDWSVENELNIAQSQQILGHISTTLGLWQMYSNQQFADSFLKAVQHHQKAATFRPNHYNTQFEFAVSLFNLANYVDAEAHTVEQRYQQAITALEKLTKHADATILTTAKLVRFYTDYAYQKYQHGKPADEPLAQADHWVGAALKMSPDSSYTLLAAATLYWTYTDYLVLKGQNPEQYLKAAIDTFDQVIQKQPDKWNHRYNQISAMLSGVTFYLEQDQIQSQALAVIVEKLNHLATVVSADISLNSHYGYYHNMQASNEILKGNDPLDALQLARFYNETCIKSPVDARTCFNQLATTWITEQRWKIIQPDHLMMFGSAALEVLQQGLVEYPNHHLLMAQMGRLYWLRTQWQSLNKSNQIEQLEMAHEYLSKATAGNELLMHTFGGDLKAVEAVLNSLNET